MGVPHDHPEIFDWDFPPKTIQLFGNPHDELETSCGSGFSKARLPDQISKAVEGRSKGNAGVDPLGMAIHGNKNF